MNLDEYRAAVVASVPCPACLAEVGGLCVRLPEPLSEDYPTALRDATAFVPGYVNYVHDDRSAAYYNSNMARKAGSGVADHLSMWVIDDHPSDHPDDFIAREWYIKAGRVEPSPVTVFKAPILGVVRHFVRTVAPDAIRLERAEDDDPVIIESWV